MRRQILLITTKKKCMEKMHVEGKEIEFKNLKKYLLLLPLVSLIRVVYPNTKMIDNLFFKINSEFIPKWFERISFLRLLKFKPEVTY